MHHREAALAIVEWSEANNRNLPWKKTKDPYKIWISEVILQQTQVSQGIPYYRRFIKAFPNIQRLAEASEDEVLRLWQGLGYNSRARHLHTAAKTIVRDHQGRFPRSYEEIRSLKGIGDYTAAAIASFAYGLPTPVLDSNVIRVVSRLYGIAGYSGERNTRAEMLAILERMIEREDPAVFNQAMMDFGALQCTARSPDCNDCPVGDRCVAMRDGLVDMLPVKKTKPAKQQRFFHYYIIRDGSGLVISKREKRDIWQHLYEFPCVETTSSRSPHPTTRDKLLQQYGLEPGHSPEGKAAYAQTLTHQDIHCRFYEIRRRRVARSKIVPSAARFELFENLRNFAFPKVIRTYLQDNSLYI